MERKPRRGPDRSARMVRDLLRPDEKQAEQSPPTTTVRDVLSLYRPDLSAVLQEMDVPSYRYQQIFEHLFRRPGLPFAAATALPPSVRPALDQAGQSTLTVVTAASSQDHTTKLLLSAADGATFEMVIMRYRARVTACISSQVGCPVGCTFCATGQMGFERNLSAAEIVDQVRIASTMVADEDMRLTNLVYMGMGEPLLNLQAVLDSISILTDPRGLNMGHRSISISTVGIPAGIRRLARNEPQVNLALSLHAPDDQTRSLLVGESHRHPLDKVLAAAWDHFDITHRKLLVEYVLIESINDSVAQARRLAKLLGGHVVTVNLLAWNPVDNLRLAPKAPDRGHVGSRQDRRSRQQPPTLKSSSPAASVAFRDALLAAGIETVVRRSKGTGIGAACGQLAGRTRPQTAHTEPAPRTRKPRPAREDR